MEILAWEVVSQVIRLVCFVFIVGVVAHFYQAFKL